MGGPGFAPTVTDLSSARLTITYNGEQGDLPDSVDYDTPDDAIKQIAKESVRGGYVTGITADPNAEFDDFVVDRFPAREDIPIPRISLRPKTPFGAYL
jgi:hypothetical protein